MYSRIFLFLALLWAQAGHANIKTVDSDNWSDQYDNIFAKNTDRYFGPAFDWRWFKAQAIAESGLRNTAVSHSGARGIMQLIPSTFKEIQRDQDYIGDLETPEGNIAAGIYYIRELFRKWQEMPEQDRLFMAFASYNAGYYRVLKSYKKSKVKTWHHIEKTLPKETRNYVARIRKLMEDNEKLPERMTLLAAYF
jgi:membrane-bound lytic murein transglycosylase F